MKEVIIEEVTKVTKYEAIDGTLFEVKEECKKYDNTAFAVINAKYKKLVVKETTEKRFFTVGSYDSLIDIVKINTEEDKDTVLKMQAYYRTNENIIDRVSDLCDTCLTNSENRLIIYRGYECGEDFRVVDGANQYIENFKKKIYGDIC